MNGHDNLLQVATGGGTISHYFNLHVVVPSAFILGSGEYHIGEGSTISLVCIIENVSTVYSTLNVRLLICCIQRGTDGVCIVDVVLGGMKLELRVKTGSLAGCTHSQ